MLSELFTIVLFLILLYLWLRPYFCSKKAIMRWANKNRYTIVSKKLKLFDTGPYTFIDNFYYAVYFLKIRDQKKNEKLCWVACGDYFLIHPTQIRVSWHKPDIHGFPFLSYYLSVLNFVGLLAFIVLYLFIFSGKLFEII